MTDHECPTCGDTFDTRRGLGVHHSSQHDERLPNRTCAHCATEFYSDYSKKYCSESCRDEAISFKGKRNPNYRDAKEATECDICGAEFRYYPSEKPGRFCEECIENEPWRTPLDIDGEDNPRWNGGKIRLTCEVCDATIERHPSGVTSDVTLCGRDCFETWLSESFTGEGHPNWQGGAVTPYGKGWNRVREAALDRDDYACVVCGTDADELGRNPDVHHLLPVRRFVDSPLFVEEDAHTVDNVVTLCPSCHRQAEFGNISRAELRSLAGLDY